ncbi:TPA: tail assembly protein [Mannheimia haemolytica]|uniref:Tail assembly protein n=4 Tax=Mannheimia haemolytica TaxID=75985 RepID=A0A248ZZK6_MANHA|nr:tail assembly protein [Mannheimia haemolytica]YP_009203392.1 tail protein [Mannheimia phage vB_MhS_535AP2]AJA73390.1 tail assembly protein I [Mannheimia phage vB_MhS_3927AP1]AWW72692.1 tail assembly protein [Pasteurellaceae bacterium 12565]AGI32324.1 tail assembly protein [Mannheimia haemolytica USDA-ARS-USMARC-183]AGI32705.1 tail assembly protein [Mannheimia haemolytica USDA-ARS-USMARC-183]AGK02107.1 tail assembly protein I [Mannheimia haemolytica M42548]
MITVKFYGHLKTFGTDFKILVKDIAEAIRALCSQLKGLREALRDGVYKVRIGKQYLDPSALEKGLFYCLKKGQTIHFTPVVKGAKSGGIFQAVLGVALIGAAFALGPIGLGLVGSATAMTVGAMGASMLLGGVSQMLTKMPKAPTMGNETEKESSTAFSNLNNLVAQGKPVPLAYGLIRTGSLVISQGVETITIKENQPASNKKTGFRK